jgi:hypothetical protein
MRKYGGKHIGAVNPKIIYVFFCPAPAHRLIRGGGLHFTRSSCMDLNWMLNNSDISSLDIPHKIGRKRCPG